MDNDHVWDRFGAYDEEKMLESWWRVKILHRGSDELLTDEFRKPSGNMLELSQSISKKFGLTSRRFRFYRPNGKKALRDDTMLKHVCEDGGTLEAEQVLRPAVLFLGMPCVRSKSVLYVLYGLFFKVKGEHQKVAPVDIFLPLSEDKTRCLGFGILTVEFPFQAVSVSSGLQGLSLEVPLSKYEKKDFSIKTMLYSEYVKDLDKLDMFEQREWRKFHNHVALWKESTGIMDYQVKKGEVLLVNLPEVSWAEGHIILSMIRCYARSINLPGTESVVCTMSFNHDTLLTVGMCILELSAEDLVDELVRWFDGCPLCSSTHLIRAIDNKNFDKLTKSAEYLQPYEADMDKWRRGVFVKFAA